MNTAHDAQYATEASYFSEMFPTRIRYSGISISAQLGGVFAGAFAPLIATALLDVSGIWLVSVYFAAMCAVSAIAAYLSPETYQEEFIGQPTQRADRPVQRAWRSARPSEHELEAQHRAGRHHVRPDRGDPRQGGEPGAA